MLKVTIYTLESLAAQRGMNGEFDPPPLVLDDVNYVSYVNSDTHGPPALVAPPKSGGPPTARPGDSVVYINTDIVPAWEIERVGE